MYDFYPSKYPCVLFLYGLSNGTGTILHWHIVAPEIKMLLSSQPVWSKVFHPIWTFVGMFILTSGVLRKALGQECEYLVFVCHCENI